MTGSLRDLARTPAARRRTTTSTSCSRTERRCATTIRAASARCSGSPPAVERHPLLASLGPEPFDAAFDADYLWRATRSRSAAIKLALMDNRVVVGVGNIYANEALFRAGIRPALSRTPRLAGRASPGSSASVRDVLTEAIAKGGSTLRDYVDSDGEPGYFQLGYFVYGRDGRTLPRLRHRDTRVAHRAARDRSIARPASAVTLARRLATGAADVGGAVPAGCDVRRRGPAVTVRHGQTRHGPARLVLACR